MKETVRTAVVQFDGTWLNPKANAARMATIVTEEGAAGVDLVVFPELASSGYFSPAIDGFDPEFARRYRACAETIPGPTTTTIAAACAATDAYVAVGVLERDAVDPDVLYNSMALIGPAGVIGTYRKVHLPGAEKHYFRAGDGIPVFSTPLGAIGMSICYDGRFPELTRTLALRGAEIVCSGWAVMEWPGVIVEESQKFRAYTRAQENGIYYLAANRSGVEGSTTFMGHSAIAGPSGEILAYSTRRSADVLHATLRANALHDYRSRLGIFSNRRTDLYADLASPDHPSVPPTASDWVRLGVPAVD